MFETTLLFLILFVNCEFCEITSSPQTPASDITSEIFLQQEHQQQRDDHAEQVYTGEQLKIIQMKQHALKKVIQILMAISVSMGGQFVAVSCIPLYFLNKYVALGFYALHNSTIAALVIMFLMTHPRVEEMQKLFVANGKKWFGRNRGSSFESKLNCTLPDLSNTYNFARVPLLSFLISSMTLMA
ncbi:hypothetical protein C9374_005992 [Naegleria lovaniensis]|uniref:Uncharacterized protein n=1 Tax=Naegleria lovaniensis TaxID=51637 RepID=A0AA88GN32_NAELO|nr:uncharacterized protein C9374_014209 [Naegleria lovaniensis]XP_044547288.1 uncharacterized protein C9374_005992 [Naegleria lovaniensis]KAG2370794.1 hypothetical protein C9374_014209 [Naegleria lovaniensis]KAG2381608.1 hypothetical protein C9374_005992 [Naegleria lovaniensis]